jgi:hypothetical protein
VKERPILFSTPMVRAILEGRKSVTRRALKPQPRMSPDAASAPARALTRPCPYGTPGDRLWVKETFWAYGQWRSAHDFAGALRWSFDDRTQAAGLDYRYDAHDPSLLLHQRQAGLETWWKRPALFMPRVASRLVLEISHIGVGRARDVDDAQILAEGVNPGAHGSNTLQQAWEALWTTINGLESWEANPWVWEVGFRVADDRIEDRIPVLRAAPA